MNTLGKTKTSPFFAAEGGFDALRARWSKLMQDKEARKALTASHHALYVILIGRDWRRGFSAPKDPARILASPEAIVTSLVHVPRFLNTQECLGYRVLGSAVEGVRSLEWRSAPNPFRGLLAENAGALIQAALPVFGDTYLPVTAYGPAEE